MSTQPSEAACTTRWAVRPKVLEEGEMGKLIRGMPTGYPLDYDFGPGWVKLKHQTVYPRVAVALMEMGYTVYLASIPEKPPTK